MNERKRRLAAKERIDSPHCLTRWEYPSSLEGVCLEVCETTSVLKTENDNKKKNGKSHDPRKKVIVQRGKDEKRFEMTVDFFCQRPSEQVVRSSQCTMKDKNLQQANSGISVCRGEKCSSATFFVALNHVFSTTLRKNERS